ncbi:MAG: peptidylprolyl isomerase [Candidatus Eremiobacteraeota bacterium]|nr:peptidylprolyl isomerase [Candidatus Eremiobacteraeota bacterium]
MPKAYRVIAGLATALLTVSLAACSSGGSIATVNGQAISKSDFDAKLEGSPASRGVLNQMVQESLINQYAKDNNITITDDQITKKEDALKAQYPAGQFDQLLKARGLTEADVKNALREQLIIDQAVGKGVQVTDAQIKAYFDKNHAQFDKPGQVRARHILVPSLPIANKVEADLKAGKDFADEAKQYSTDPSSKVKGGELGFFRKGQMVPSFEAAAFTLPIGKISAPVKSPFGYHIIQVEERQGGQKATVASAHDQIAELLKQQQEQPLIQPFLASLQSKAKIVVNDPRFADLFPSPPPAAAPAPSAAAPTTAPTTK